MWSVDQDWILHVWNLYTVELVQVCVVWRGVHMQIYDAWLRCTNMFCSSDKICGHVLAVQSGFASSHDDLLYLCKCGRLDMLRKHNSKIPPDCAAICKK